MPLLLVAIQLGGPTTARVHAVVGLAGLVTYLLLAATNVVMLPLQAWQLIRPANVTALK